jgi:hypothetical protein
MGAELGMEAGRYGIKVLVAGTVNMGAELTWKQVDIVAGLDFPAGRYGC